MKEDEEHISDQLKKAHAKASALRRIRRFLPHEAIKRYKVFILLPHLEYCSPLFLGIGTGQRNRLEDGKNLEVPKWYGTYIYWKPF